MKAMIKVMVFGTVLLAACSTSDTTSRMYGRDEYHGAEARLNNGNVESEDAYRGNAGNSGVIERRDISQERPTLNSDTYTGGNVNVNAQNSNNNRVPDVNNSTGTGTGSGVNTSPFNNDGDINR